MFTKKDIDNIPDIAQKYRSLDAASITFTVEQIEKKLRKVKTTKSAGHDGLQLKALSELSASIKFPLSIIFQKITSPKNGRKII